MKSQKHLSYNELIGIRTSRRTYRAEPLPEPVLDAIRTVISHPVAAPLGTPISFSLTGVDQVPAGRTQPGTYGFIRGARYFIVGQMEPSMPAFLDYGFVLETIILELTRLNLGTCWLGGTFSRSQFAGMINLPDKQVIPAITPVGYASDHHRFGERIIRLSAGSARRQDSGRLFFEENPAQPIKLTGEHPLGGLLEAVRLAPSASNLQPWRIVVEGNRMNFYLSRKTGYRKAFDSIDLQMIDMGIAMSHLDLTARESGRLPVWKIEKDSAPVNGWEYVISVFLSDQS